MRAVRTLPSREGKRRKNRASRRGSRDRGQRGEVLRLVERSLQAGLSRAALSGRQGWEEGGARE